MPDPIDTTNIDEILNTIKYTVLNHKVTEKDWESEVWFKITEPVKQKFELYCHKQVIEARLADNHDWDSETFKPITVCRRCATTFNIRGNKSCKGKMAKIGLREAELRKTL